LDVHERERLNNITIRHML